jgi:hypothetical protein
LEKEEEERNGSRKEEEEKELSEYLGHDLGRHDVENGEQDQREEGRNRNGQHFRYPVEGCPTRHTTHNTTRA